MEEEFGENIHIVLNAPNSLTLCIVHLKVYMLVPIYCKKLPWWWLSEVLAYRYVMRSHFIAIFLNQNHTTLFLPKPMFLLVWSSCSLPGLCSISENGWLLLQHLCCDCTQISRSQFSMIDHSVCSWANDHLSPLMEWRVLSNTMSVGQCGWSF